MKLIDKDGVDRDFYFEMQKHSMHLFSHFTARQLAVYELYKKTIELPGSVLEFGVRNGANFFFLARLIEIFNSAQRHDGVAARHLFGFDTFSGFPNISEQDQSPRAWAEMEVGGVASNYELFKRDFDTFIKQTSLTERLHIVRGDVLETLDEFLREWSGLRYSLVYLDMDLYEPTKLCLERLWDSIVPGGIVVLDEYGLPEFPGETKAVDEFIKDKNIPLGSFSWCFTPSAYLVKP